MAVTFAGEDRMKWMLHRRPGIPTGLMVVMIGATLFGGPATAGAPVLSPAQEWALATSALLTASNRERHDLLGGSERTEAEIQRTRDLLNRWWDVRDRERLLQSLEWVKQRGHRSEFAQFVAEISRRTAAEVAAIQADPRLPEETRQRLILVVREHARLGSKGLLGWDYARYVSLCRWGYLVGYLSEKEAWSRIMPAAQRVQATFDSWRELGENYLIGREFWSPAEMTSTGPRYRDALRQLLSDPQSPWVRLPWRTTLAGSGGQWAPVTGRPK